MRSLRSVVWACAALGICILAKTRVATAADWSQSFNDGRPTWTVRTGVSDFREQLHDRRPGAAKGGDAGEFLQGEVLRDDVVVTYEHAVPRSIVLDELSVSVWLKSNQPGWKLAVRVVFPESQSLDSREPPSFWIEGETSEQDRRWEQLTCRTSDQAIRERVLRYRASTKRDLVQRGAYIDRVALWGAMPSGTSQTAIDELLIRPYVAAEESTDMESEQVVSIGGPQSEFRLDRLYVDGKPLFLRMAVDRGERAETLRRAGLNTVWVQDAADARRMKELRDEGLWAVATPPRPTSMVRMASGSSGSSPFGRSSRPLEIARASSTSGNVGLAPFGRDVDPVLFWMLGARFGAEWKDDVREWSHQIQAADRDRMRPIAADVAGDEAYFSRHVNLMGISRHAPHCTLNLRDFERWLSQRRAQARPGTYCWTWLQTEAPINLQQLRGTSRGPMYAEPELLWLQAHAAISAGYRGLGYWSQSPLDGDDDFSRERMAALSLLNLELSLVEPWLAGGVVVSQEPLRLENDDGASTSKGSLLAAMANGGSRDGGRPNGPASKPDALATILRSEQGTLMLLTWLPDGAQCVPGVMAASRATVVVPGAHESASAWEVSPTRVQYLARKNVSGGVAVTLNNFDRTAMVLLTSDTRVPAELERRAADVAEHAARLQAELAGRKVARVAEVDRTLRDRRLGSNSSPQWFRLAKNELDRTTRSLSRHEFHQASSAASKAMQLARLCQSGHWQSAVKKVGSPSANPFVATFQTLPEAWELSQRWTGMTPAPVTNAPVAGDFEDAARVTAEGWSVSDAAAPTGGKDSAAGGKIELVTGGRAGGVCLRMSAAQEAVGPSRLEIASPPFPVAAGQIVQASGWVKAPVELGPGEGLIISDSSLGRTAARRFSSKTDWQRFELLRPIVQTGDFTLRLELASAGEVLIDDVRFEVRSNTAKPDTATEPAPPADKARSPFDILPSLPKLPSFPGSKSRGK